MNLETFKSKIPDENQELYNFPQFIPDLPFLIEKIREEDNWKKQPLNSLTVLQSEGRRTLLVTLMPGTEFNSHQNGKFIRFQIYEGKIDFQAKNETITVKKGQRLVYRDKGRYKVSALEETILLLTLVTGRNLSAERLIVYNAD